MAFNIHISGPKMILHNKTIADMFVNQLNNNQGLFGVRYFIMYTDYAFTVLFTYLSICHVYNYVL